MDGNATRCTMERDIVIVAGIGFRGAAELSSLCTALKMATDLLGHRGIDILATLDNKAGTAAFCALADTLGAKTVAVAAHDLKAQETMTKSERIEQRFGTGSVAEAAALAAAGPDAELLVLRVVSPDGMATAAIAKSAEGSKT